MRPFCRKKPMSIKFLLLGGGGFWVSGGECRFYFYWRGFFWNKGGVSVSLRLSTFAHVCLRLLAFSPLRLLAFVRVCLRLLTFAYVCSHLLTPPFVAPPSAWHWNFLWQFPQQILSETWFSRIVPSAGLQVCPWRRWSCLSNRVLVVVETNFEPSKTLFLKAFHSPQNGLD